MNKCCSLRLSHEEYRWDISVSRCWWYKMTNCIDPVMNMSEQYRIYKHSKITGEIIKSYSWKCKRPHWRTFDHRFPRKWWQLVSFIFIIFDFPLQILSFRITNEWMIPRLFKANCCLQWNWLPLVKASVQVHWYLFLGSEFTYK